MKIGGERFLREDIKNIKVVGNKKYNEKFFNKFIPDLVKFFFVPMLTLLVKPTCRPTMLA